jgi:hypothetical protein
MSNRFALLLSCVLLIALPASSHAVPVVTAGSATEHVGDVFTIPISITNAMNLTSLQFDLFFSPPSPPILKVTATGVTESAFFAQGDVTVFNPGFVDNANGRTLGVSDALTFQSPVNGSGVLVNIEFQAVAIGGAPLTFSNVFLNLSDSGFLTEPGLVTVLPGAVVPELSTLMLVSVGLGAWALRCWRTFSSPPSPRGSSVLADINNFSVLARHLAAHPLERVSERSGLRVPDDKGTGSSGVGAHGDDVGSSGRRCSIWRSTGVARAPRCS